ncbi:acyl-CoA dehydrogenase C-terminal domain-containing protein [Algiphilus sp. W345]|uniref:Acyl-CoA dehydrogenase C-terminal domain-containing protein n=1 Tax=Banduia mediterranea TaxID=3075609 RepID=A0ABU2WH76_9GAMM|nr:acyl-CoA dehydrogenase C-terminal domain-containing protein [Algiphilus sp. W345]MDT0497226.1 acyl-CoA dehydrogenase C-terminal domain-containing protein [Algiphilus sp. W345]
MFLEAFGHVVMAWSWLRQAVVAQGADHNGTDENFHRGKLAAAGWFSQWELPKTAPQFALLRSLDRRYLDMRDDWF